ncbi:outer membrane beta-barrel protein [Sphingobacterium sp. Mn56C]|uniref:outer membrane beta-barrel protein n=1 Tax=Sphingobacterium sp. Mn56C TaxID=3395261 RepID=UPI003BD29752
MKNILTKYTLATFFIASGYYAHANNDFGNETTQAALDSTVTEVATKITGLSIGVSDEKKVIKYPRFYGGITFTRIDWGFSRLIDDGSFNLSDNNKFLSYSKASNFGFDILQVGMRLNDNFKTYLSAGFEWNYLRLKQNILLKEGSSPIDFEEIDPSDVYFKKNVLTTTNLRLPLSFEWRSNKNNRGERVKIAFGAMTGILLKGSQRLKSDKNGKQRFRDNYSLSSFQYGPFVRVGYGSFGVFGKYYVNDMFEKSPEQKGLNNFTFGLTLGF